MIDYRRLSCASVAACGVEYFGTGGTRYWTRWSNGETTYKDTSTCWQSTKIRGVFWTLPSTQFLGSGHAPIPSHVEMRAQVTAGGSPPAGGG